MKKIAGVFLATILGVFSLMTPVGATSATGVEIFAEAADCGKSFLGFYPWYNGLTDNNCDIVAPEQGTNGKNIAAFIWTIILNVMADLMLAIGYIAFGVIIWGGFYMITAGGDPGKVAKSRKILAAGVAGSLIGIFASLIAHAIVSLL